MSDHPSLSELDAAQPFSRRHIGIDDDARATMLAALGFETLDDLMRAAVPGGIRAEAELALPEAASEEQAARELRALAARNTPREPMIGLGYYGTTTPPVVRRNVLEDLRDVALVVVVGEQRTVPVARRAGRAQVLRS